MLLVVATFTNKKIETLLHEVKTGLNEMEESKNNNNYGMQNYVPMN